MLSANSTIGKIWTLSTLILSLSRLGQSVEGNVSDLCSEKHCEDCASGELSKCSNDATMSDRGDLCGCCKSCVKFRDCGESCGSQLAVRTFGNFDDTQSRVTILATTSCKESLICKNFTCEKLESVDFAGNERVKNNENVSFDRSGHLINLIVRGREFQLIYGREILEDLKILIESIDKNQLLINEIEARILYERFKDFSHFENNEHVIETKKITDNLRNSEVMTILQNSLLTTYASKILKFKNSGKNFRKKRELQSEIDKKIDERMSKEGSRVYVYDIVNKTPGSFEDFGHWSMGQKDQINPEENTETTESVVDDGIDSQVNIRIDGAPKIINLEENDRNFSKKRNYDDLEIFVDNVRQDVPVVSTVTPSLENLPNFNSRVISPSEENIENYTNVWENEKDEFPDRFINYELNFPKHPASLKTFDVRNELDTFGKKSVDEFSDQLDRIETKAVDIENALFDMMEKIDERLDDIEDKKMDIERSEIEPGGRNESVEKLSTPRHGIIVHLSNENSSVRPSSRSGEFLSSRNWRMMRNPFNLSKIDEKANVAREIARHGKSDRGRQESPVRRSRNFFKARTNVVGRETIPIFSSNKDSSGGNYYNDRNYEPRLFSLERSNLEVTSGFTHRPVWPLNLILNRAIGVDRSKRKSERLIERRGRRLKFENPKGEESAIFLETQIPKSIVSDRIEERSERLMGKYDDDDVSNWREEGPSINLFIVDENNQEFDTVSSSSELQKNHVVTMEQDRPENEEVDDNYPVFPEYLDYSDRSGKMEHVESVSTLETTEATVNLEKGEKVNSRKKRGVHWNSNNSFLRTQDIENFDKKISKVEILPRQPSDMTESPLNLDKGEKVNSRKTRDVHWNSNNSFLRTQNIENFNKKMSKVEILSRQTSDMTESPLNLDKAEKVNSRKTRDVDSNSNDSFLRTQNVENFDKKISKVATPSRKRSKRGVEMVDWLRAAQEYHERLHQVRNAAMKTWLASREALEDTNFTDVKLFTREIPSYLERYRLENLEENYSDLGFEASREKPDETLSLSETSGKPSEISNHPGPRKYTIITSGNSTIKIDRFFENDDVDFVDEQSAQGTTETKVTEGIPIVVRENDYFDHMYESFEADDHEFDYEDSTARMSEWGDRVDVIESSSVEIPRNDEISKVNEDDIDESKKDDEDPTTRFKRDSPVLLFKIKGNPTSKDVLVWPSNWQDLIDRHSRINRKGGSTWRPAKRRSYSRISKIDPKFVVNGTFDNDD